jgi:hypothetical protein
MNQKELSNAYAGFFHKHDAGKYFVAQMQGLLEDNHRQAEDRPESARDLVNQAKGVRLILEHIESVSNLSKKVSRPKEDS